MVRHNQKAEETMIDWNNILPKSWPPVIGAVGTLALAGGAGWLITHYYEVGKGVGAKDLAVGEKAKELDFPSFSKSLTQASTDFT